MLVIKKLFPIQTPKRWSAYFKGANPFRRYTCLISGKHLVMSDTPYERSIYAEMLPKIRGRVLILGMGIGLLNSMMALEQATEVVVVDIDENAFRLARDYLRRKPHQAYEEIVADANNDVALRHKLRGRRFDVIVWDLHGPKYHPIYSQFLGHGGSLLRWEAK